jgi:quercetin dioxygenase-like cupin family protein
MIQIRDFEEVDAQPVGKGVIMRVVMGPAQGAPNFTMRVFEVQPGCATPLHSHWWEHEVFVLSGRGVANTGREETPIAHGSTVFVPGGDRHQFRNTGEGVLRFICVVPQDWLEGVSPGAPVTPA